MDSLGSRLKLTRTAASPPISQMDVATHFGVDRSSAYRWEGDKQTISVDHIRRFVELCGFTGPVVADICKWIAYGGKVPRIVETRAAKAKGAA